MEIGMSPQPLLIQQANTLQQISTHQR